jgi:hypothetical protein
MDYLFSKVSFHKTVTLIHMLLYQFHWRNKSGNFHYFIKSNLDVLSYIVI